jgi:predicted glycosyltransferase
MSRRRVFFYVQHLLGIGHQRRGATLVRAMQQAGLDVTFVSGGHDVPSLDLGGARLAQLPPTRAVDLYFKQLVDEHDRPIDDAWRARRAGLLLDAYKACAPHVVIFELFPFGRRQMRVELTPLLEAAVAAPQRPLVVSSVRDILVAQDKPGRNDEMVDLVERFFDHVLVHGDPTFIPFERTFPHAGRIREKLSYTGYVVDGSGRRGAPGDDGWDEVLVSAGGGAVGHNLLREAIRARPLTSLRDKTWRVLVGLKAPREELDELRGLAGPGVIVERARGDFTSLLMNCALSISQAGYNTVMEAMRAGCRAVVVPYAGGLETEQTLRAALLAERGVLQVVPESDVSAAQIAAAAERALSRPPAAAAGIATNGARRTAALVSGWADEVPW